MLAHDAPLDDVLPEEPPLLDDPPLDDVLPLDDPPLLLDAEHAPPWLSAAPLPHWYVVPLTHLELPQLIVAETPLSLTEQEQPPPPLELPELLPELLPEPPELLELPELLLEHAA